MTDRLDLLLLGATGFTGKRCIPYLYKLCTSDGGDGNNLTWGVAGRSDSRLRQILKKAGEEMGADLQKIPTVVVDIQDEESLKNMACRANVVINCCGPFRFLGEPVVKACIANGTHHVDISAEPQFMEKIQLELDEEAKEKNVYVITACGFDCVPTDLGVVFLQQQFEGTLNSVNTYLDIWLQNGNNNTSVIGYSPTTIVNYGTWESLVHSAANWSEINQIRNKLFPESMSKYQPELKQKYLPHSCEIVEGWAAPLPTADSSSVKRTQKYFYDVDKKRPVQISTYIVAKSFCQMLLLALFASLLYVFSRFRLGINFLLKHPGLFSLGVFREEPPSDEVIQQTFYQFTLYGEGWSDKLGHDEYLYKKPCDKSILGQVRGRNGYDLTSVGVVLSAIILLTEEDKLPKQGGVFSAGACFARTSLIEKLKEHGVDFQILYQKSL